MLLMGRDGMRAAAIPSALCEIAQAEEFVLKTADYSACMPYIASYGIHI